MLLDNVVALYPGLPKPNVEMPEQMVQRMLRDAAESDKALVVLIKDVGGVWKVDFQLASLSNAETIIALDIVKATIMKSVLGG